MKIKIFSEFGIGNNSLCSTEIESGKREKRVAKFIIPPKIKGLYIRVWLGKIAFAISTNRLFNYKVKNKIKFKILLGIEGSR